MILLFTTETCGACKLIKSYLDIDYREIMLNDDTRVHFNHYNVRSAPTIVFIRDGQEQWRHVGYISQEDFMTQYEVVYG